MATFFVQVDGADLSQGDLLPDCPIPEFPTNFGGLAGVSNVPFRTGDLIIVTQSCDLANRKAPLVALCPIFGIPSIVAIDSRFRNQKELEILRKGRYEGLYMLASPDDPNNNQHARIVDFRQIFSLPPLFLEAHAAGLGNRWRLQPPFLEHFSQAFARFFMRVGLPSSVPEFK